MTNYKGNISTNFYRIIPYLIGVSKTKINDKLNTYSLHITPFLEIMIGVNGTRYGSKETIK